MFDIISNVAGVVFSRWPHSVLSGICWGRAESVGVKTDRTTKGNKYLMTAFPGVGVCGEVKIFAP